MFKRMLNMFSPNLKGEKPVENELVILEDKIQFSKSQIWKNQKKYYVDKGVSAWELDVPFYITSNSFIAESYAKVVISFMRDFLKNNPSASQFPFYILELGTGTGQFSFYFLKSLLKMQKTLQLDFISICYVMSDCNVNLFDFFEKHEALKPYLNAGILDFSVYDINEPGDIYLHRAKKTIGLEQLKNPLTVIANYIFDSVATDVFTVRDGKLYESLVTVKTDPSNLKDGILIDSKKTHLSYHEIPVEDHYYHNAFDSILFNYQKKLNNAHFQFPITVLSLLEHFKTLSNNQLLLLSSDKGHSTIDELNALNFSYPYLVYHGGCFSVMVNYHAISEFMRKGSGSGMIDQKKGLIVTGIFTTGFLLDEFLHFNSITEQILDGFTPSDYCLVSDSFVENHHQYSLQTLVAHLNLLSWDPALFFQVSKRVRILAEQENSSRVSFLLKKMNSMIDDFYYVPKKSDEPFQIGLFLQRMKQYEKAILCYQKSITYFCDVTAMCNIGACHYSLGRKSEALMFLNQALQIQPKFELAEKMIDVIAKEN